MKTININGKDCTIEELNKLIEDSKNSVYPIYCQLLSSGKIVKFTDLKKGILVKNDSNGAGAECVGHSSNYYLSYDDKNTWKHLPVCPKTGFFHGQLVWAWSNDHIHFRALTFYNAINKAVFPLSNRRFNIVGYNNYLPFEGNWPDWALEAYKTLEL